MTAQSVQQLIAGFTVIVLIVSTVTLDRTLFTMTADYWTRLAHIGLRYGLIAFIVWCLWVFFV